jgi:hypothetical protein
VPIVLCKQCNKEFKAKSSWLKRGYGKYCSLACKYVGNRKGKIIKCDVCGEEKYKQLKQLRRSKSGKLFCSKSCQTKWRNSEFIGSKHANWKTGRSAYKSVLTRHGVPKKCTLCETDDQRVLAVHHIDENHLNNDVVNLAWVCHNCHHLVHHDSVYKYRFMNEILKRR